jgi:hypothetical protein
MRVEQRIGRIDRIGQRFDEVTIINYSYNDTVETDIYDRLDDRIGLFETVVGEMQPILSGVSKRIRDATLKADRDESQQVVEETDREISQEMDEQEQEDRVDVGESLEDVDSLVPQEVIDEAKLDAWQSYDHPDLVDVGDTEYEYPAPFQTQGLRPVLTDSKALENVGIEFTPIAELGIELAGGEFEDALAHKGSLYRISVRGTSVDLPHIDSEQTLAQTIAPGDDEIAVTFSASCSDEFPSVQYVAPGHPLLSQLTDTVRSASDDTTRLHRQAVRRSDEVSRPVVCGWGRDGSVSRITVDGDVSEEVGATILESWSESFLDNRNKSESNST